MTGLRKLTFAVLALGLCVSCQKDNLGGEIDPTPVADGSYVFNISVGGNSTFDSGSKAVKSGWEDGDKVLLFFSSSGGEYQSTYAVLEYKESSSSSWEAKIPSSFRLVYQNGNVTAVFVPKFSKMFDTTTGKDVSPQNGIVDDFEPEFDGTNWTIECGDVYYSSGNAAYTSRTEGVTTYVSADVDLYIADGYAQFYMYRGDTSEMGSVEQDDANAGNYDMTCFQTETSTPKVQNYNKLKVTNGLVNPDDAFAQGIMHGYSYGNGRGTVFYGKVVDPNNTANTTVDIEISAVVEKALYKKTVNLASSTGKFEPIAYKFNIGPVSTSSVTKGGTKAAPNSSWTKTEGVLPGLFNIGTATNPNYVRFSKGNLYCTATKSGKNYNFTYAFADKQYTWAERNVTNGIEKETKTCSGKYISYFFAFSEKIGNDWSGDTFNAFTHIYKTLEDNLYNNINLEKYWNNYFVAGSNAGFTREWGTAFGSSSPWYTMSWSEWKNLCTNQSVVKCTVNNVSGWLLVPANYKYTINKGTNYEARQFQQLEKEGLVFLPAAGQYSLWTIGGGWGKKYYHSENVSCYCTSSNHYPYYCNYIYEGTPLYCYCACYATFNDDGFMNVEKRGDLDEDKTYMTDFYCTDNFDREDKKNDRYLDINIGNHCYEDFTAGSVRLVLPQ